ncbi:PH domain-containing protein [Actinoplanes sp. NPDC051411]|uniref:PH domain-containing protein n=1 Tax=Actinoplanes sp. NPDC051411 TaxID=3155522 RepID=UPI00341C9FC0
MPETWTRPYEPGAGRWLVIAWEAPALALLGWSTARKFALSGTGVWIMVAVLAAIWLIGAWRILRMGVYAGADGVLIRGLLRSRTLRWQEVAHVHLHKATHRLGPWEIESGLTVLIERRDGSMVNTELWAQGVDFHRRPRVFRAVYRELRALHLDAVTG